MEGAELTINSKGVNRRHMAGYHHSQPGPALQGLACLGSPCWRLGWVFHRCLPWQKEREVHPRAKAAASPLGNQSPALQGQGPLCLAQLLCLFSAPCPDFQPARLLSLRYEQRLSFYSERTSIFEHYPSTDNKYYKQQSSEGMPEPCC